MTDPYDPFAIAGREDEPLDFTEKPVDPFSELFFDMIESWERSYEEAFSGSWATKPLEDIESDIREMLMIVGAHAEDCHPRKPDLTWGEWDYVITESHIASYYDLNPLIIQSPYEDAGGLSYLVPYGATRAERRAARGSKPHGIKQTISTYDPKRKR